MSLILDSLQRRQPNSGREAEHRRTISAEQVLAPLGYSRAVRGRTRRPLGLLLVALGLVAGLAAWVTLGGARGPGGAAAPGVASVPTPSAPVDRPADAASARQHVEPPATARAPTPDTAATGAPVVGGETSPEVAARAPAELLLGDITLPREAPRAAGGGPAAAGVPVQGRANVVAQIVASSEPVVPGVLAAAEDETPPPITPSAPAEAPASAAAEPVAAPPRVEPPVAVAETPAPAAVAPPAAEPPVEELLAERRPPGDIVLPREAPRAPRESGTRDAPATELASAPTVGGEATVAAQLSVAQPVPEVAEPGSEAAVTVAGGKPTRSGSLEGEANAAAQVIASSEPVAPGVLAAAEDETPPPITPSAPAEAPASAAAEPVAPLAEPPVAIARAPASASAKSVAVEQRAEPPVAVAEAPTTPAAEPATTELLAERRPPGDIVLPREAPAAPRESATPDAPATPLASARAVAGHANVAARLTAAQPAPAVAETKVEPPVEVADAGPIDADVDQPAADMPAPAVGPAKPTVAEAAPASAGPTPRSVPTLSRANAPNTRAAVEIVPAAPRRAAPIPRPARPFEPRVSLATSTARASGVIGDQPPTPPPPVSTDARAAVPETDHFRLALSAQRLGDVDGALQHYRAVLERNERNAEAYNNLGVVLQQQDRLEEARRAFERAIAIDAGHVKAHNNLGVVHLRTGRPDAAAVEFRRALEFDPRNVDAMVNLAICLKTGGRRSESRAVLIRALESDRSNPATHYNLALEYDEAGDSSKAVDHYRQFLRFGTIEHVTLAAGVRHRIDVLGGGTR